MRRVFNTLAGTVLVLGFASTGALAETTLSVDGVTPTRDTFSMKIDFDGGTAAAFVADTSPAGETHLYAEFFIRMDAAFAMSGAGAGADRHNLFRVKDNALPGSQPPIRLILKNGNLGVIVQALVRDDSNTQLGTQAILLTNDAWQRIRIDWQAASAPGANDGYLRIRRGNGPVKARENLDNDTHTLDRQEFGAPGGVDTGTTGRIVYDDFASLRTTTDWP